MNITPDTMRKLLESQAHVIVYASAQLGHLQELAAHAGALGGHLTVKGAAALQPNVLVDLANQGKGRITFDFTS
jgi:hypothetical protein